MLKTLLLPGILSCRVTISLSPNWTVSKCIQTPYMYLDVLANMDTWELLAVMYTHFPTSALGLLVIPANFPAPTDLTCYDVCLNLNAAALLTHYSRNIIVVSQTIESVAK